MIYISTKILNKVGGDPQFLSEIKESILYHNGTYSYGNTREGQVVVTKQPNDDSLYVCFREEMEHPPISVKPVKP